jgi:hypothetical protein
VTKHIIALDQSLKKESKSHTLKSALRGTAKAQTVPQNDFATLRKERQSASTGAWDKYLVVKEYEFVGLCL